MQTNEDYKANIFDEYNDICSKLAIITFELQALLTNLTKVCKVSSTKLHIIYPFKKNGLTMYEDIYTNANSKHSTNEKEVDF